MATNGRTQQPGNLQDAMRKIRAQETRRDGPVLSGLDSVTRLEALREDLTELIADIPAEADFFDFSITDDKTPRMLIDDTTFVVAAHGHTGFRMLKNSRAGRLLLKETSNASEMANSVVHYVAERLSGLEADAPQPTPMREAPPVFKPRRTVSQPVRPKNVVRQPAQNFEARRPSQNRAMAQPETVYVEVPVKTRTFWRSLFWYFAGLVSGAAGLLAYAWFRTDVDAFVQKWLSAAGL